MFTERKEVGEFGFSYKKPEEEFYCLWVKDCAYCFDKETAQGFVNLMKEQWPNLNYGVTKQEKPEEIKLTPQVKRTMGIWRAQTAYGLINDLNRIRYEYEIDNKEFTIDQCRKLCNTIFEKLEEKKNLKNSLKDFNDHTDAIAKTIKRFIGESTKEVKKYSAEEMELSSYDGLPYWAPLGGWKTLTAKRLAWKKGLNDYYLLSSRQAVEHIGQYRGFDYCIYFLSKGYRTAYVIFEGYMWEFQIKSISKYIEDNNKEPHGGITWRKPLSTGYAVEYTIGFTAGNPQDGLDPQRGDEIFGNDFSPDANRWKYIRHSNYIDGEVRSKEFMINECHKLIDAIIEALNDKR